MSANFIPDPLIAPGATAKVPDLADTQKGTFELYHGLSSLGEPVHEDNYKVCYSSQWFYIYTNTLGMNALTSLTIVSKRTGDQYIQPFYKTLNPANVSLYSEGRNALWMPTSGIWAKEQYIKTFGPSPVDRFLMDGYLGRHYIKPWTNQLIPYYPSSWGGLRTYFQPLSEAVDQLARVVDTDRIARLDKVVEQRWG